MITAHVPHPSSATKAAPVAAQAPEAATPAPSQPLPGLTGCSVLEMLFNRAAPSLTPGELEHLSQQAGELAQTIAQRAADVAEGIGLLIADESAAHGEPDDSSTFRNSSDLPGLLWHFGDVFQQVAGLVSVAGEAAFLARGARR
jgi:hypothetical protein